MDTVNLKRLAKELNLAISTVSRALSDSHEVSSETRDRVRALAKKLGFQPNPHASSLRQNKSKTIAVVIPEIDNHFFSQVLNGVETVAQDKGYHVLIYLTHEDYNKEKSILQLLRNGRVDGLMISVSNTTRNFEHLENCREAGIPMVSFDRIDEQIDVPKVITDDAAIAFKATSHLIKNGCRRIAFLSMSDSLSISSGRQSGYVRALEKHGMAKQQLVVECGADDKQNAQEIRKLLQGKQRPDAIFAAVERFAINTYEVCHELRVAIPQELKVIGFSNLPAAALLDPPMTTIVQPAYEMGKESTSILFKIIEKKALLHSEKRIVVPSLLIERRSSAV
ncbi:MAG TPA: LacI family DNA-binding transcriptional regulator [Chitinophagaceae bacterium]